MTTKEKIIAELSSCLELSDRELTERIFGCGANTHRVNTSCWELAENGITIRVKKEGCIKNVLFADSHIKKEKSREYLPQRQEKGLEPFAELETIEFGGYEFTYVGELKPLMEFDEKVIKHYPQSRYKNEKGLPLLKNGDGPFCKFSINHKYLETRGVYIWVINQEIVYIGETDNLKSLFNKGYGNISPRNCFVGGQSTNVKMNKVVLNTYENGDKVHLYFFQTAEYKRIEKDLLGRFKCKYTTKNN